MKNYHVQCKPDSNAQAAFCTSRTSPEDNRSAVDRITQRVDWYFKSCNVGIYDPNAEDMDDVLKSWVCQAAVTDVLIGRHLGLSEASNIAYMPPGALMCAVAIADEVAK